MYLYSLIMIVAFSKEALLEYSCFKTICSNANSIGASVAVERPDFSKGWPGIAVPPGSAHSYHGVVKMSNISLCH